MTVRLLGTVEVVVRFDVNKGGRAGLEGQLVRAVAHRTKTICDCVVEYGMYTLLIDYREDVSYLGGGRLSSFAKVQQYVWGGGVWSVDEVTGEVALMIDRDSMRYFGDIVVLDAAGKERQIAMDVPGLWLDPDVSEGELERLMREYAEANFSEVKDFVVKEEVGKVERLCRRLERCKSEVLEVEELLNEAKAVLDEVGEMDFEAFLRQR